MEYEIKFLYKLFDSDNWPGLANTNTLDNLNEIADEVFKKGTLEGGMASLLIYHQLTAYFGRIRTA
jgi:hypothetical protein